MTIEEKWASLSPRERDVWVAEAVFGAKVVKTYKSARYTYFITDKRINKPCCGPMEDRYDHDDYYEAPDYTTDLAAAWEVKSRLQSDWKLCYRFTQALFEHVKNRLGGQLSALYLILHVTPEDICLAALKALS